MACVWRLSFGKIRKFSGHRGIWTHHSVCQKIIDPDDVKTKEVRRALDDVKEKDIYWEYHQKEHGMAYEKKPFKFTCKEGRVYMWCSCGYSKTQPFCDGTHKIQHFKITLKPVPFVCKETKEYWFCNCKQTKHRPFCDGTHRSKEVQEGHSIVND